MDLKIKLSEVNRYDSYTDLEVKKLLEAAKAEKKEWKRYLVPLAVYTGARRKEMVQLLSENIKHDEETGRHYLLITDEGEDQSIKTENSKRQIPIHQELIQMGVY